MSTKREYPLTPFRIKDGRVLHWPAEFMTESDRCWVMSGGVVDLGDPIINGMVEGQRYKLEAAPGQAPTWTEDQAPTPVLRHIETQRIIRKEAQEAATEPAVKKAEPPQVAGPRISSKEYDLAEDGSPKAKQPPAPPPPPKKSTVRASDVAAAVKQDAGTPPPKTEKSEPVDVSGEGAAK